MVKVTEYKLRKTKPEKELIQIIYKLKCITDNLSQDGLNKITKMQNLSLNEFKKIERMNNLSINTLKQIAITRNIKNY